MERLCSPRVQWEGTFSVHSLWTWGGGEGERGGEGGGRGGGGGEGGRGRGGEGRVVNTHKRGECCHYWNMNIQGYYVIMAQTWDL